MTPIAVAGSRASPRMIRAAGPSSGAGGPGASGGPAPTTFAPASRQARAADSPRPLVAPTITTTRFESAPPATGQC